MCRIVKGLFHNNFKPSAPFHGKKQWRVSVYFEEFLLETWNLNKNTFSTIYENKFLMTVFQQAINKSVSNSCSSFYTQWVPKIHGKNLSNTKEVAEDQLKPIKDCSLK